MVEDHTPAFARIVARAGMTEGDAQRTISNQAPLADDLMAVSGEELVLLSNLWEGANVPPAQAIAAEIARRSVEALGSNHQAIAASTSAINDLRDATDRWSTWLTRLTICIFGLTLLLVVLGVAQTCNR